MIEYPVKPVCHFCDKQVDSIMMLNHESDDAFIFRVLCHGRTLDFLCSREILKDKELVLTILDHMMVDLFYITTEELSTYMNIIKYFKYDHLPEHLQEVSKHFYDLAQKVRKISNNQETEMALRKLLEAKDCAVRSTLGD